MQTRRLLDAHTHINKHIHTQGETVSTARGSTTKRSQLRAEHLNTILIRALPTPTDLYSLCRIKNTMHYKQEPGNTLTHCFFDSFVCFYKQNALLKLKWWLLDRIVCILLWRECATFPARGYAFHMKEALYEILMRTPCKPTILWISKLCVPEHETWDDMCDVTVFKMRVVCG